MTNSHDKSIALAYQEQERLSAKQHQVLFHAHNLARYTGLLTSLFSAVGKANISASDIQSNDAFKCARLSAEGISSTLKEACWQTVSSSVHELWSTTARLLQSVEKAPVESEMPNIPSLLHVAALVIYDHLRVNLPSDVCTYREIVADVALCNFSTKLSPSVDLHDDDKDLIVRNLISVLRSGAFR